MAYTPEKAATRAVRGRVRRRRRVREGAGRRRGPPQRRRPACRATGGRERRAAAPARCRRLPAGTAPGAVHAGPRPPPPPAAAGPLARGDGRARRRARGAAPAARSTGSRPSCGWTRLARRRGRGAAAGAAGPGSARARAWSETLLARTADAGRTGPAARRPPPQERAGARRRDQPRRPRPGGRRTGRGRARRHAGAAVVPAPGRRDHPGRRGRSRPTRCSRRTARLAGTRDLLWYAAAALLVERAARAVSRVDVATLADLERVLATALRWAGHRGAER